MHQHLKIFVCLTFLILCQTLNGQSFIDLSVQVGFDQGGINSGMSIGDINGDGWEDIYVSRKAADNLLYINQGNFEFLELGASYGLDFSGNTRLSLLFDFDNDGDLDVFLGNILEPSRLLRNDGGTFTDISLSANVNFNSNVQSASAVDYDNDGDLDLYIARTLESNILLRNEGDYFFNYSLQSGIVDDGHSMGAIFFDYDNDGDQDLYQTRDFATGNYFFENKDGIFEDITELTQTAYEGDGMGVDAADVNGDGRLDLYFSNLYANVLYIQNEAGSFDRVEDPLLMDEGMGWGVFFFDALNNGLQDIYLANDSQFAVNGENHSNKLLLNRGDVHFEAPLMNEEVNNMMASYGAACADFDKDGRMDFVVANRGGASNQIFKNNSPSQNFLSVDLRGTQSNKQAVGAKVQIYSEGKSWMDYKRVGSGYASQRTSSLHFGLGQIEELDSLIIHWPSGKKQIFEDIASNQFLSINETFGFSSGGPLVWTEPDFPTQQDDIVLYFDASQGNAALQGFTGDVYAHTGVITSASTTPTDWKYVQGNWGTVDPNVLMTSEGNDIYSLSYNIEDYYGIPPGEVVEQLAFVFRNADGTTVGRDTDGSDIYLDVYPPDEGLLSNLQSPSDDGEIIYLGDSIFINLSINQKAWVTIEDNGSLIYQDSTEQLELWVTPQTLDFHQLEFEVSKDSETQSLLRSYLVLDGNETLEDPPTGVKPGLNYLSGGSYIFSLTAPLKEHVFLLCPENEYKVDLAYRMKKSLDESTYWIELPRVLFENGKNSYQYLVDGNLRIADPFSEVVLDPWNDDEVQSDVMSELPDYPEALTTGIVTAFDIEKEIFDWTIDDFQKPEKSNLVIYEIMMRDFLGDKNYKSLLDSLDYLAYLGVNAIELMPIQEFEGNQSWGYNPSFHMAVDKYYGSRIQLKRVIDECHKRDIAVILDVVFNHAFSQSPLCQLYWNPQDFRPSAESPYLNETAKHPFNVGYDFNHESPYTKQWVKRVLAHWIEEYKMDGFRFDLSKGLTQTFSGNNAGLMSQYDQSRVDILEDYSNFIWSLDPTAYSIMEHFAVNAEERTLSDKGMMLWGNMTHEFAEAAMGYSSTLRGADYTDRNWNDPHLIAYMESHDEERMGYKLLTFGNSNSNYSTKELATATERVAAASAIYFSIPGPKMLWQFGELAYDFSINRCTNGTISGNCRLDPKPIRWDYFQDENRNNLYEKVAALTYLKTNYPTFSTDDFSLSDNNGFIKKVHLNHSEMDAVSLANFGISNANVAPDFPYTGTWYEYFTGNERVVTDLSASIDFLPGEYRIYTSERIDPPNGTFTSTKEIAHVNLGISPNPSIAGEELFLEIELNLKISNVLIQDLQGRSYPLEFSHLGEALSLQTPKDILPGLYLITIQAESGFYNDKLIIVD